jgi:hypothetical protein
MCRSSGNRLQSTIPESGEEEGQEARLGALEERFGAQEERPAANRSPRNQKEESGQPHQKKR